MLKMKGYINKHEFENMFGLKKSTQAKYRMLGKIPFYKIGKFILYKETEIEDWFKGSFVPSIKEVSKSAETNATLLLVKKRELDSKYLKYKSNINQ